MFHLVSNLQFPMKRVKSGLRQVNDSGGETVERERTNQAVNLSLGIKEEGRKINSLYTGVTGHCFWSRAKNSAFNAQEDDISLTKSAQSYACLHISDIHPLNLDLS